MLPVLCLVSILLVSSSRITSKKKTYTLFPQDPPKLNRCKELLSMNEELKQARKAFDTDEENLRKAFEADDDKLGSTE